MWLLLIEHPLVHFYPTTLTRLLMNEWQYFLCLGIPINHYLHFLYVLSNLLSNPLFQINLINRENAYAVILPTRKRGWGFSYRSQSSKLNKLSKRLLLKQVKELVN